ncbi:MAG: hypothetical protein AAF961_14375, partial [Planctomycetota bacterium]
MIRFARLDDPQASWTSGGGERLKRALAILALILAVTATVSWTWWLERPEATNDQLTLYGNVDLRQ